MKAGWSAATGKSKIFWDNDSDSRGTTSTTRVLGTHRCQGIPIRGVRLFGLAVFRRQVLNAAGAVGELASVSNVRPEPRRCCRCWRPDHRSRFAAISLSVRKWPAAIIIGWCRGLRSFFHPPWSLFGRVWVNYLGVVTNGTRHRN